MFAYALRRVTGMIPSLLLLLLITVVMVRLIPGTVVDLMLQEQGGKTDQRAAVEKNLGLDKPVVVSYLKYVGGAVHGDLGRSLWTGQSVRGRIASRVPVTLTLMFLS